MVMKDLPEDSKIAMFSKFLVPFCFFIFFCYTIGELLSDAYFPPDKDIPEMKSRLSGDRVGTGPMLNIDYCYSCGYYKAFTEYSQLIRERYPDFIIKGSYYEPTGLNRFLARVLNLSKMIFLMLVLSGKNIFAATGRVEPRWWLWCMQNKVYTCLAVFFGCNMFENMLVSSGAFEISLDGIPLWSKLESGRIPQPAELFSIIDQQLLSVNYAKYSETFT